MSEQESQHTPWELATQRYVTGQVVTGSITRVAPFGAFACLEQGMEGLIPRSELPSWMNPLQHLYEGMRLPLRILELDPARRRLKLSLRQVEEQR
jgi:small subunit ribosomal protein S1